MRVVVCHPDVAGVVALRVEQAYSGLDFEIRESMVVEKVKATGRYILPDGAVVDPPDILVRTRFVTYGPEDLDFLLYAGILREEQSLMFYLFDLKQIERFYHFEPVFF